MRTALPSLAVRLVVLLLGSRLAAQTANSSDLDAQLRSACQEADVQAVQSLLQRGARPNEKDEFGDTALIAAVAGQNLEVVRLLVEHGADVRARGSRHGSALQQAVISIGVVDEDAHRLIVEFLLDHGADVNARDDLGYTPLSVSVGDNNLDVVQLLLQRGADVHAADKDGSTILMAAAYENQVATMKLLLDSGADADIEKRDKNGRTALLIAAQQDSLRALKLLLAKGADARVLDKKNRNALHLAMIGRVSELTPFKGDPELVKLLLGKGVDPNQKDAEGRTVLGEAIAHKRTAVIKLLREHGAR